MSSLNWVGNARKCLAKYPLFIMLKEIFIYLTLAHYCFLLSSHYCFLLSSHYCRTFLYLFCAEGLNKRRVITGTVIPMISVRRWLVTILLTIVHCRPVRKRNVRGLQLKSLIAHWQTSDISIRILLSIIEGIFNNDLVWVTSSMLPVITECYRIQMKSSILFITRDSFYNIPFFHNDSLLHFG